MKTQDFVSLDFSSMGILNKTLIIILLIFIIPPCFPFLLFFLIFFLIILFIFIFFIKFIKDEKKCKKCNNICNAIHFQRDFENWTSGNNDIDKFIQDTQLSSHTIHEIRNALEWISYDRFYNIKYITNEKFYKVLRANWIDGYIEKWDNKNQKWERKDQKMFEVMKSLNDSINDDKLNEVYYY
jgi:hypothetical protein